MFGDLTFGSVVRLLGIGGFLVFAVVQDAKFVRRQRASQGRVPWARFVRSSVTVASVYGMSSALVLLYGVFVLSGGERSLSAFSEAITWRLFAQYPVLYLVVIAIGFGLVVHETRATRRLAEIDEKISNLTDPARQHQEGDEVGRKPMRLLGLLLMPVGILVTLAGLLVWTKPIVAIAVPGLLLTLGGLLAILWNTDVAD